jgi:hypothetical protein
MNMAVLPQSVEDVLFATRGDMTMEEFAGELGIKLKTLEGVMYDGKKITAALDRAYCNYIDVFPGYLLWVEQNYNRALKAYLDSYNETWR